MQDTVKIVFQGLAVLSSTVKKSIVVVNGEQHSASEFIQEGTNYKTMIVPYGSIVTISETPGYNNKIYPLYSSFNIATSQNNITLHAVFDLFIGATSVSSTVSEV